MAVKAGSSMFGMRSAERARRLRVGYPLREPGGSVRVSRSVPSTRKKRRGGDSSGSATMRDRQDQERRLGVRRGGRRVMGG